MPFSFIYSSIKLHRLVERKYFHFELLFIAEEKPKNHCDLLFNSNRLKLNGLDYDKLKNIVIIIEIMKNGFCKGIYRIIASNQLELCTVIVSQSLLTLGPSSRLHVQRATISMNLLILRHIICNER